MGGGLIRTPALGGYSPADARSFDQSVTRPPAVVPGPPGQPSETALSVSVLYSAKSATIDAGAMYVQPASWEGAEESEFPGGKEEDLLGAQHSAPTRPVFVPVPTLEEAKEATRDLKDALEILYSSPAALESPSIVSRSTSSQPHPLESPDVREGHAAILPSTTMCVIQAFSLLRENPEAQNVVASLACDKNLWDATMKNEKVLEFCKTHQINVPVAAVAEQSEEPINKNGKNMGNSIDRNPPHSTENGLSDFMVIKLKVKKMASSLYDLVENLMGGTRAAGYSSSTVTMTATNTTACDDGFADMAPVASFLALTIATIILVLLKRG